MHGTNDFWIMGFLLCHTCCDTGPWLLQSDPKLSQFGRILWQTCVSFPSNVDFILTIRCFLYDYGRILWQTCVSFPSNADFILTIRCFLYDFMRVFKIATIADNLLNTQWSHKYSIRHFIFIIYIFKFM